MIKEGSIMHLFSIIVPVYNVEIYLDECIQSLIHQIYKNIEIILIDDGSTDVSGIMCDGYERKDSRIKVIHKDNGGLSSARNAGVAQAKGDYIVFVDSDDYISLDFLELIEQMLLKKPFDMIVADTINFMDGNKPKEKKFNNKNINMTPEEALESVYYQKHFDTSAWGKVMKAEIVKKHPFVNGILYEDFKNIYKFMSECKSILYMPEVKYFYRQRINSIMNSSFDDRKLILIDIAQENLDFVKGNYPNITEAAVRRYVYANFHILGRTIKTKVMWEKSEEIRRNILDYKKNILINNKISLKEKIGICILSLGLKPYKVFWNLYCRVKGKVI
ncbi:MAG: glycosyltransferase [Ruminococcus flavefaciens]|nr:glycosyltransferase [Ruminococcus flavefaciens]